MRSITLKYAGECRKCGAALPAGAEAVHEKRVGIFCLGCAPTDPEEIRAYRQEGADRRAARYEEWADKRREKAEALHKQNEPFRGDYAFNTQPGYIPERARVIRREDRAFEHSRTANRFEAKAKSLRKVRVAGDRERERQKIRDHIRPLLKVGMEVDTGMYGRGIVKRINKKTATISNTGSSKTFTVAVDLSWIRIVPEAKE